MFDEIVRGIHVRESEYKPDLIDMRELDEFFFCEKYTKDFLLRKEVCNKISAAQKRLPSGYFFMIYEAFRPRSRQIELWNKIHTQLQNDHPNWKEESKFVVEAEKYVANPHGFGSGHQAGVAVDITLCDDKGYEFFMGAEVQEFNEKTYTNCVSLMKEEIERRSILRKALESEGLINYPEEWWHFSYGDRLWAEVTKRDYAFYAPID